jgi:glycosyltransferase involved in cell wall biosynthesis
MIKELVTIVMPTYNDEKYLKKSIEDILQQSYEKFELIIVNDGSTDNTEKIILELSSKYDRIKYYEKQNGGTGSALNFGFEKSSGEFGTWVSSDDSKSETFLEDLVFFMKKNRDIEFVCSSFRSDYLNKIVKAYEKKDGKLHRFSILEQDKHSGKNSGEWFLVDDWAELNYFSCMLGVCFMFTMRLKNKMGPYLNIPGEDYYMTMKMAFNSRVGYLDKCLGTHHNPPDSLSMENRNCTVKANSLSRRFFMEKAKWNLRKIPKIANFYWGSNKMSFLRFLTIYSFKKLNPDWSIHLYVPKNISGENTWLTKGGDRHHKIDNLEYNGEDYYGKLIDEVALKVIKVDFSKSFITENAPEPHKSDLLTWQILSTKGGLWCDMDIVFCKPITNLQVNYQNKNIDTVTSYDYRIKEFDGSPTKPIGFLMSSGNNVYFKKHAIECKKCYKDSQYQSIGTNVVKRVANTFEECIKKFYTQKFANLNPDSVYHFHFQKMNEIYNENKQIPDNCIGIHWYGGHPMSQEFNKILNHKNYKDFDNTISNVIKEVLS